MNDAKELRKIIEKMNQSVEKTMEKAADTLVEVCKIELNRIEAAGEYFKDAKEICISFAEIGQDFTEFAVDSITQKNEKGYMKKQCEREGEGEYIFLAEAIRNEWSIADGDASYTKLLKFQEILEERGFFCCIENPEGNFVVVLPLELE